MKHKLRLAKASMLTVLISLGAEAVETDDSASALKLNGLKIALIKNAVGSKDIIAGDYVRGIDKLERSSTIRLSAYDKAMGLCVANIKLNNLETAKDACSEAISSIDGISGRGRHNKFLKAMAFSNRAIVRYLSKDNQGALADFNSALMFNDSDIVKGNIQTLKAKVDLLADSNTNELYSE